MKMIFSRIARFTAGLLLCMTVSPGQAFAAASHPPATIDFNAMALALRYTTMQLSYDCGGVNNQRQQFLGSYTIPGCPGYRYQLHVNFLGVSEWSQYVGADEFGVQIQDAKSSGN